MNYENLLEKRAIDLTAGQLAKVLAFELEEKRKAEKESPSYSYKGMNGIMEIFQCSKSKAMAIRASGIIDDACVQYGNSFLIDKPIALELMRNKDQRNSSYQKK